jgi:hypothetical protein
MIWTVTDRDHTSVIKRYPPSCFLRRICSSSETGTGLPPELEGGFESLPPGPGIGCLARRCPMLRSYAPSGQHLSPSRSADWAHNRRLPPSHCYLVRKGKNPAGARLSEWFVYVTAPASISWPRRSPVWEGKQTPYRVLIAATNGAPASSVLSQHFVLSGLERWQKQLGLDH